MNDKSLCDIGRPATLKAGEIRAGEARACTWPELTEYEQREASFRGFPRGAGVLYIPRARYDSDAGELALSRWTRA